MSSGVQSIEIVEGVGNNKNLGVTDECLLLFGNGDGGGGPTPRMLSKVSGVGGPTPLVPVADKHRS